MIRLPIEPLERWFLVAHPAPDIHTHQQEDKSGTPSADRLALAVGVDRAAIHRWRRHGIPLFSADNAATNVGFHPTAFWPQWFDLDPDVPQCGTRDGSNQHIRLGEPQCDECLAAEAARARRRYAESLRPKPEPHPLIAAVMAAEVEDARKRTAA